MKSSKSLLIVLIGIILLTYVKSSAQIAIKDSHDIKESFLQFHNKEYAFFINKGTKISSTEDFSNFKLILVGETEPNIAIHLDTLGMNKTNKVLFKKIISVNISPNISNPNIEINKKACMSSTDNIPFKKNGIVLQVFNEYYCKGADMKTILKNNYNTTEYIFLTKKVDAKKYFKKQNELTIN
jgi:hypothetical protein